MINDDPILAKKLNADGCHLGQKDTDIKEARKIIGNKIIAIVFRVKIIAKDMSKVWGLALIKGDTNAIAVAPQIAEPLDSNRFNLESKPTNLPIE